MIIDAWMQHPSAEFLADPMFDSLRRWAHGRLGGGQGDQKGEIPVEAADCLEDLPGLRLDDETTELFLHGNAEQVFGLP